MATGNRESGLQFLARLGTRPCFENIDRVLFPNGLKAKDVVEVYGVDGCGKTQLLIHIIATCILPETVEKTHIGGLDCAVVFIDTEFQLSMIRLTSVLEARLNNALIDSKSERKNLDVESIIKSCLSKLYVIRCHNSSQLILTLYYVESLLANQPQIGCLMLDSLSSFYWIDKSIGDTQSNQEAPQRHLAAAINKLVTSYNIIVMATKFALIKKKERSGDEASSPYVDGEAQDVVVEHSEYLCKNWQKLVTHRIIMQCVKYKDNLGNLIEKLSLSSRPVNDQQKNYIDFIIDNQGLVFKAKIS